MFLPDDAVRVADVSVLAVSAVRKGLIERKEHIK